MSQLPLHKKYDVAIIGAGIGGLVAANILSKAGLSVIVLEKNNAVGGYLMGFTRHRFTFDTAIHWLNQCMPGGMVHFVFESLGTDYPKVSSQKRIKRFIGDDFDYLLTSNPDELRDLLIKKFPLDEKGILLFFQKAKALGEAMAKYGNQIRSTETMSFFEKIKNIFPALRFVLPFIPLVPYADKNKTKGLNKYFKSPEIHQLFASEKDLLSCLIPIGWAYVGDFLNPPKGGSQSFVAWLKHVAENFGAQIFTYCDVQKIILENNTAKGIIFQHRGEHLEIFSDYVIAACDLETVYKKMLPPNSISPKIIEKLEQAVLYDSSVTIHIALSKPASELGFNEEMTLITRQDITPEEQTGGDASKSEILILSPSFRDNSMAPAGKGSITIFMPALIEQNNFWGATKNEQGEWERGEAYQNCKDKIAKILIQRVAEKLCLNLTDFIEFYEVATPITHLRYSGNKNGTMMGGRPGKANYQAKIANYKTPIQHLILGGHWAELGGGVPIATKAGFNAALLILKEKKPLAFAQYVKYINQEITAEEIRKSPLFLQYKNDWDRKLTPAELLEIRRQNSDS